MLGDVIFGKLKFYIQDSSLLLFLVILFKGMLKKKSRWHVCDYFSPSKGTLHLDRAVHAEVALMILEAYQKYLAQKPYAGLLSESMKQVFHFLIYGEHLYL